MQSIDASGDETLFKRLKTSLVETSRTQTYQVIARTQQRAIRSNGDAGDGDIFFGDKLMGALVLAEVPNSDVAGAIATDQFALVRMNDDVVDGAPVAVVALDGALVRVPDFHRAVFAASHHPLAFDVEGDAGNVAAVAFEGQDWRRVCRAYVVQLHFFAACCCQQPLVRRYA